MPPKVTRVAAALIAGVGSLAPILARRFRRGRVDLPPDQGEEPLRQSELVEAEASPVVSGGEEAVGATPVVAESPAVEPAPPREPPPPSPARLAAQQAVAEGMALVENGQLEEGATALRRAVKSDPTLADGWHKLGVVHARQGKLGKAVVELAEAAHLDPTDDIRQDLEEVQAIRRHRKALARNPENADSHLRLGLLYFVREMGDEALAEFSEAARLKPGLSDAHLYLGLEYHFRGELARAESEYQKALRLNPGNPMAREHLALLRRAPDSLGVALEAEEEGASRSLVRDVIDKLEMAQKRS